MHIAKPTYSLPASLASAAALLLLLLCAFASAPGAEAGPRCGSGLLCPDDGWFCCAPGREGCCKNIGTGGPFGRRLRTIELMPSSDPTLPPTVNIWQAGRLLQQHATTRRAKLDPSGDSVVENDGSNRILNRPIRAFYADRDMENRPGVGGDGRMMGNAKKGVTGAYSQQEALIARGNEVADTPGFQVADESGK
uniref:Granulins domain-containing protein n=1 Tax=Tetradesmus obliquus TaxID=3088 RepID=A0A383VT27_TETOB|eukprot:jgi/Sobl393_1/2448/SZX68070.1